LPGGRAVQEAQLLNMTAPARGEITGASDELLPVAIVQNLKKLVGFLGQSSSRALSRKAAVWV
jgi:hypothetical protein